MGRFFSRVTPSEGGSSLTVDGLTCVQPEATSMETSTKVDIRREASLNEVDLDNLPSDPGLRPEVTSYPPNLIEQVRRAYLLKGPCQPLSHDFPQKIEGKRKRRFVPSWFKENKLWLEYSIAKDAAFCLYCYLFSSRNAEKGHDAFVSEGFNTWHKKDRLHQHVGDHNCEHNICRMACEDLMNQSQHIEVSIARESKQSRIEYRCRLNASVICLCYLVMQGLAFRGHDESDESLDQGNFLELLKVVASCNDEIKQVALNNAPKNLKLTSPDIQRDIVNAAAVETTKAIVSDIGNGFVHVSDTSAISLEKGIDALLSTHGLSVSSLRGQGYDGASNMGGEFKGLKSLILKRNPRAYYIHCFAHQLQLTIVVVAQKHQIVGSFFNTVSRLCNVVGGSCKRRDMLRESQREKVIEAIASDGIETGRGLNQELGLKRPGDTRWSSHYGTLTNLIHLFSSILDVTEFVGDHGHDNSQRAEAGDLLDIVGQFEFVFVLHLMRQILGITHDLSQVLQRKNQDIVNAVHLVKVAKTRLQGMRDRGWDLLLAEVAQFCSKNKIGMLDWDDGYVARGKGRRRAEIMTNLHYYRVCLFYTVIDMQASELNHRFDEINTDFFLCMSCFNPRDSFSAFDTKKLLLLAKFYPSEFSEVDLYKLECQLENFIVDVRMDKKFLDLSGIGGLAEKMVSTRKDQVFPLVYLLVKLCLTLPVATATVERIFSAMKFIKNILRNRMGDQLVNDCLIPYIENDVFVNVINEAIMERYQLMKERGGIL